tara:strand:- start:870 stop:1811 length:942 start_codon:yes stop_codon:yes gene_type:complete
MKLNNYCYICDSKDAQILFTFKGEDKHLAAVLETKPEDDMNWMICNNCGFVYRSPVLEQHEYEKLYENYDMDIFEEVTPDEYFDNIISMPIGASENKEKAKWLKDILNRNRSNDDLKILDIGCGGGTLLYILNAELSVESICGVELNPVYADLAKRRLNADIRNESYESGIFGQEFDLLINTKVLEHIPDPLPFLKEMYQDLSNGGILFIEVPHVSDMYNFPLTDERFTIPHIYFFSEGTLSALLEKAGFNILEYRIYSASRNRSYLQIIAKKIKKPDVAWTLSGPLDNVSSIINKVQKNKNNNRISENKDEK